MRSPFLCQNAEANYEQESTFYLCCFLLVCLFSLHPAFGQNLQYENQTIEKIDIVIHTHSGDLCDSNAATARLRTQQGGLFSQVDFDEDLKILAQDFDRVDPSVEKMNKMSPLPLIFGLNRHSLNPLARQSSCQNDPIAKRAGHQLFCRV